MTEPGHEAATYQLAGPDALSQDDCAGILTTVLGRPIRAVAKPIEDFRRDAAAAGMPAERIEVMTKMNAHYDAHGLVGNPNGCAGFWDVSRPGSPSSSVANCLSSNRSVV